MSRTSKAPRRYRARVAPRRRARAGGSRTRVHWDKVGRVALVLVLLAVLASYVRPTVNLAGTWRDARAAEERALELRQENAKLERQTKELRSPAAMIREARKLGYVAEHEQAYVIRAFAD